MLHLGESVPVKSHRDAQNIPLKTEQTPNQGSCFDSFQFRRNRAFTD